MFLNRIGHILVIWSYFLIVGVCNAIRYYKSYVTKVKYIACKVSGHRPQKSAESSMDLGGAEEGPGREISLLWVNWRCC